MVRVSWNFNKPVESLGGKKEINNWGLNTVFIFYFLMGQMVQLRVWLYHWFPIPNSESQAVSIPSSITMVPPQTRAVLLSVSPWNCAVFKLLRYVTCSWSSPNKCTFPPKGFQKHNEGGRGWSMHFVGVSLPTAAVSYTIFLAWNSPLPHLAVFFFKCLGGGRSQALLHSSTPMHLRN